MSQRRVLNTGLAKIGVKESTNKVTTAVFLVTFANNRDSCKASDSMFSTVFKCIYQVIVKQKLTF